MVSATGMELMVNMHVHPVVGNMLFKSLTEFLSVSLAQESFYQK